MGAQQQQQQQGIPDAQLWGLQPRYSTVNIRKQIIALSFELFLLAEHLFMPNTVTPKDSTSLNHFCISFSKSHPCYETAHLYIHGFEPGTPEITLDRDEVLLERIEILKFCSDSALFQKASPQRGFQDQQNFPTTHLKGNLKIPGKVFQNAMKMGTNLLSIQKTLTLM